MFVFKAGVLNCIPAFFIKNVKEMLKLEIIVFGMLVYSIFVSTKTNRHGKNNYTIKQFKIRNAR